MKACIPFPVSNLYSPWCNDSFLPLRAPWLRNCCEAARAETLHAAASEAMGSQLAGKWVEGWQAVGRR